ncbi:unnamed protein product [Peronospora effusa]|nr:unnamed protein product [Peronospora effusa]
MYLLLESANVLPKLFNDVLVLPAGHFCDRCAESACSHTTQLSSGPRLDVSQVSRQHSWVSRQLPQADALSSVLVVRAGHGDMTVSNALGSNVRLERRDRHPVCLAALYSGGTGIYLLYPLTCVFLVVLDAAYVTFSFLRGLDII